MGTGGHSAGWIAYNLCQISVWQWFLMSLSNLLYIISECVKPGMAKCPCFLHSSEPLTAEMALTAKISLELEAPLYFMISHNEKMISWSACHPCQSSPLLMKREMWTSDQAQTALPEMSVTELISNACSHVGVIFLSGE